MLRLKVKGVKEFERKFNSFHIENPRAIALAMNRSARVAQTASLRKMRGKWNIRARDLKPYVSVERATVSKPYFIFKFHSKAINLHEFHAKKEDDGVSYKLQKKKKTLGGAFIQGSGRNTFVLKRVGKDRYPILPHFTITPSTMFLKEKADKEFVTVFFKGKSKTGIGEGFNARYLHELKRILS